MWISKERLEGGSRSGLLGEGWRLVCGGGFVGFVESGSFCVVGVGF